MFPVLCATREDVTTSWITPRLFQMHEILCVYKALALAAGQALLCTQLLGFTSSSRSILCYHGDKLIYYICMISLPSELDCNKFCLFLVQLAFTSRMLEIDQWIFILQYYIVTIWWQCVKKLFHMKLFLT